MKPASYQEALDAYTFSRPGGPITEVIHEYTVIPVSEGIINESYKVTSKLTGDSFLLQRINQTVFPDPPAVQHNYEMLWKHLQTNTGFFIPEPKYFPGDAGLFCDSWDQYWRVFEFITGAQTLMIPENVTQVKVVAQTFAGFTANLEDFDPGLLQPVISGFHNLSNRFKQFQRSIHSRNYERLQKASALINELKKRERYTNFYDVLTESEEFPQRVMHHDAKISNILFDEETGLVICPVDFDTAMPGYFFSDIGDMIRSMTPGEDENSTLIGELGIRKDYYDAILNGYLDGMGKLLTGPEKKYIHYAGIIMTYMQALRFLADYLDGDIPGAEF